MLLGEKSEDYQSYYSYPEVNMNICTKSHCKSCLFKNQKMSSSLTRCKKNASLSTKSQLVQFKLCLMSFPRLFFLTLMGKKHHEVKKE